MKDKWSEETKPNVLSSGETSRDVEERQIHADSGEFEKEKDSPETGIIGSDEAANPRLLENVYKYTGQIKKFLGWESNPKLGGSSLRNDADATDASDDASERESKHIAVGVSIQDDAQSVQSNLSIGDLNLDVLFDEGNICLVEDSLREDLESSTDDLKNNTANIDYLSSPVEEDSRKTESPVLLNPSITEIGDFVDEMPMSLLPDKMNVGLLQEDNSSVGGILLQDPDEILKQEIEHEAKLENGAYLSDNTDINDNNESSNKSCSEIQIKTASTPEKDILCAESSEKMCENEVVSQELKTNSPAKQKLENEVALARKLSLGVVNDVLNTARHHVSELLVNKSNLEEKNAEHKTVSELSANACDLNQRNTELKTNMGESKKNLRNTETKRKIEHNLNNDLNSKLKNYQKTLNGSKTNNVNKPDFSEPPDEDTICGIGSFRPNWIQPLATPTVYLILYSIIGVLQGSYYTYLIGTLSTLEKRFAFKSKISGLIMTVDEITPLLLGVLIGYFGGRTHRPRMVAVGMLLSAACCFVSALPYFIYGPGTHLTSLDVHNKTGPEMCLSKATKELCDVDDRPPTLAAVLFLLLGNFCKGFGNLAYYAIGLAYMDDNAKKKNTPIYFAVAFALRLLGPLVGFLMSSAFLKYYENPFDDPGFGPDDPRWIGGWWMGFFLQGCLLVIFTIPISLFPRRLPSHLPPAVETHSKKESLKSNFSGLLSALKRLARNPLFIFLSLNTTMAIFGSFGHYIMLPKYMENQFRLSASDASLFSGPPGLAAVMISTVIGGYLIYKYQPNAKILTAGMVIIEIIAALGYLILMIPHCQSVELSNFGINDEGFILEDACNTNCNCTTSAFTPVCGPDGKTTYFSPCFAGCEGTLHSALPYQKEQIFTNCSCVRDPTREQMVTATEGICIVENCWSQALAYIITMPIFSGITSLLRVAHTMILLRSINPEDKSVALGTFETFISLFGFIPYPVTFGALVDSACLVWEKSCGKTGNCWFYDVEKFNYLLHGASAFFCAMSALCLVGIYFLHERVHSLYDEDESEIEQYEKNNPIKIDTVSSAVTKL
ncbi:solute carrier organic anion transporter family member 1A1-like [Uloborus diversus]|uniref:solute carrier organic anion transporter family member 1A1-like n=1 Tax=Uloborus diversus TaxID=327109 RepID=UPI00240A88AC|nr:solute carrier organic anion transporter family member 1A1-like [Uloborus diversus]